MRVLPCLSGALPIIAVVRRTVLIVAVVTRTVLIVDIVTKSNVKFGLTFVIVVLMLAIFIM